MSGGRLQRIGIPWSGGGVPEPTLYLPFRSNITDASANAFGNISGSVPTVDALATSPLGLGAVAFDHTLGQHLAYADNALLNPGTEDFFFSFFASNVYYIGSNYPALLTKGTYQSSTGAFGSYYALPTDGFNFGCSNPWREATITTGTLEVWRRFTVNKAGNTATVYINTTPSGTVDMTGIDLTNTHIMQIGRDLAGAADGAFNGYLVDLVYCKGASLTAGQILDLQTTPYSDL